MSGLKISSTLGHGTGPQGQNKEAMVDLEDEKSLKKWAEVLHVSPEELRELVAQFGPRIRDIRLGLAAKKSA